MSSKLECTIWSCDAAQGIPCFNRCQLTLTWVSIIKGHNKRLHVSFNLLAGVWLPTCVTQLSIPPPSCVCAHKQYIANHHDNFDKINSWVSFSFLHEYGIQLGGPLEFDKWVFTRCLHAHLAKSLLVHVYVTLYNVVKSYFFKE